MTDKEFLAASVHFLRTAGLREAPAAWLASTREAQPSPGPRPGAARPAERASAEQAEA